MGNGPDERRPRYGRRLLPRVLDDESKATPNRVFASFTKSNDLSQGFQDATVQQVANAVNHLAYKLQTVFGPKPHHEFETLTYIGPPDIRYNIVLYAAVKCGYKVLLPSPRNPTSTNVFLMETTNSSKILCAKESLPMIEPIVSSKSEKKTMTIEALAGFFNTVLAPLYTSAIPVFGTSLRPVSGALVVEIMQQQRIRGCLLPPSVAEHFLHEPDGLELFRRLDVFCYTGGPLSSVTGDAISCVTMLCQFYGSTETGPVRQLVPRQEDWAYMEFHPNAKIELQQSDDDAFELVIFADSTKEDSVALNHNYPGVKEWQTKDLFRQHSTKGNLWRFHGRKDDILVPSNGEKLNPIPMENQLQGLPNLSGALVIGQNRFPPALLLEMKTSNVDERAAIDQIWPSIESANTSMPGHGRITRAMILLLKADKPFVRAGKGTIVRKLTENAYAYETEDLYIAITSLFQRILRHCLRLPSQ